MQSVGERVKEEAQRLHGWSLGDLARELGVSYETCRRWVQGDIAPNRSRVAKLAKLLNRTPEWVMYGIESGAMAPAADASIVSRQVTDYESLSELSERDFVKVRGLEVVSSLRQGKEVWRMADTDSQPFMGALIRELDSAPQNLRAVRVEGGSMEPLLFEGDLVLIDTGETRLKDGGVFALRVGRDLWIKRLLQLPGGGMVVTSDNKQRYRDITIDSNQLADVEILGRVKYRSGAGDF